MNIPSTKAYQTWLKAKHADRVEARQLIKTTLSRVDLSVGSEWYDIKRALIQAGLSDRTVTQAACIRADKRLQTMDVEV
jgi:hypothetical protein